MIRHIKKKKKKDWERLFRGYADFYKVEMNDEILKTVWKWLIDQSHEVNGLVYEENSKIIALAHYRKMPSPLRGKYIGFLDDLFVDPKHRRKKIAEKALAIQEKNKELGRDDISLQSLSETVYERLYKGDRNTIAEFLTYDSNLGENSALNINFTKKTSCDLKNKYNRELFKIYIWKITNFNNRNFLKQKNTFLI